METTRNCEKTQFEAKAPCQYDDPVKNQNKEQINQGNTGLPTNPSSQRLQVMSAGYEGSMKL